MPADTQSPLLHERRDLRRESMGQKQDQMIRVFGKGQGAHCPSQTHIFSLDLEISFHQSSGSKVSTRGGAGGRSCGVRHRVAFAVTLDQPDNGG